MQADKILLAIPTRGSVHNQTVSRVESIRAAHPELVVAYSAGHLSSHETREQIVRYFMTTEKEALVMLDDDVVPPRDILGMTDHLTDFDVVGAAVPMFQPQVAKIPMLMAWDYLPASRQFSVMEDAWGLTGVHVVGGVGFGCVAIHRRTFEKLEPPYFPMEYDETRTMTDDLTFCRRVQEVGMRVGCDFDRYCEHNSTVPLLKLAEGLSDHIQKVLKSD